MIPFNGADPAYSLEGKTAIITGGAAGIGLATAKFFALKKVNLVLADLNPKADEIAGSISENAVGVPGDVTDAAYRQKVLEAGIARFGRVDILINSAGIGPLDWAELLPEEVWNKTIAVNLTASFMMAQLLGKYWIDSGMTGSIVNLASQAGVIALDRHVAYCASKGGIISMTKVLAKEWGKYGIRVNAVSPTVVLTEMGHQTWDGPVGDAFKQQLPAGRFAEPEEIAAVLAFLCSEGAAMITGHNLLIDGGFTIQ